MATTGQQIIDRAAQRSSLNNLDLIPVTQLLQYLTVQERIVYLRAGRMNPDYFGKDATTSVRATATDSWDLAATPGDVAVLTWAEVAAIVGSLSGVAVGDRVNLVLQRLGDVAVSKRAYVRGRKISSFGTDLGTGANYVSQLKLFYSPIPAAVTSVSQSLTLPDEWTDLVVLPLANIMAIRDRRLDEVEPIKLELDALRALFDEAVLAFDHGVRRPLSLAPAIPIVLSPPR